MAGNQVQDPDSAEACPVRNPSLRLGQAMSAGRGRLGRAMVLAILVIAMLASALTVVAHSLWRTDAAKPLDAAGVLAQAQQAERDGRLYGPLGADHALTHYRQLLEANPEQAEARIALRRIAGTLAAAVHVEFGKGDAGQAEWLLQILRELDTPDDVVRELQLGLETEQALRIELARQAERSQLAVRRKHLLGDAGALAGFKRMLALDPGNEDASAGIDTVLHHLVVEAGRAVEEGRHASAEELLDVVAHERPDHPGLPALWRQIDLERSRQRLERLQAMETERDETTEAQALTAEASRQDVRRRERELSGRLQRAEEGFQDGRLESALDGYDAVLGEWPGHPDAMRGRVRVARAALERMRMAIEAEDIGRGEYFLRLARHAGANGEVVVHAQQVLDAMPGRGGSALVRPYLDLDGQLRLENLFRRASEAQENGHLIEPVGASAYDLYRLILAVDPLHEQAGSAFAALPGRLLAVVRAKAQQGQLDAANDAIQALQLMAPADPVLPQLRQELAAGWFRRSVDLAARGADIEARRALERSRSLDPTQPGLDEMTQRLAGN